MSKKNANTIILVSIINATRKQKLVSIDGSSMIGVKRIGHVIQITVRQGQKYVKQLKDRLLHRRFALC